MKYRPDIDGLRALAVMSVIFFHADFNLFSGGYVGVDVFFVISGFLITSSLIKSIKEKKFSLFIFYEKRMRRILPALFFTFLITCFFASFLLTPYQKSDFGLSILAATFSVANIFFYKSINYFDSSSFEKPLLHTWSLGVEEQFYFIIPLLVIFMLSKFSKKALTYLLTLLALISFTFSVYYSSHDSNYNYYLLPTRAWELLAGSILALLENKIKNHSKPLINQLFSLLGLFLLTVPIFLYDHSTSFPGASALPIILGSTLVIGFNTHKTFIYKILSFKPLVFTGLISYSAYLIHFPLFTLNRLRNAKVISIERGLLLTGVTLLLAWLMWKYIEQPFRKRNFLSPKSIYLFSFLGMVFFGTSGFAIYYYQKVPSHLNNPISKIVKHRPAKHGKYLTSKFYAAARKRAPLKDSNNLLIIGDSFSQDFYNVILESKAFSKFNIYTRHIPITCQPVYQNDSTIKNIKKSRKSYCRKRSMDIIVNEKDFKLADVIIFASSWKKWSTPFVQQSIKNVRQGRPKEIFLIGAKEFGTNPSKLIFDLWKNYDVLKNKEFKVSNKFLELNSILNSLENPHNHQYINLHKTLCPKENKCRLTTPQGELISYDGQHLTKAGASYIGDVLFTKTVLKKYK